MNEAIWRGHRVKVLSVRSTRTVILTPLSIKLVVRTAELATMDGRKRRALKDSLSFGK